MHMHLINVIVSEKITIFKFSRDFVKKELIITTPHELSKKLDELKPFMPIVIIDDNLKALTNIQKVLSTEEDNNYVISICTETFCRKFLIPFDENKGRPLIKPHEIISKLLESLTVIQNEFMEEKQK